MDILSVKEADQFSLFMIVDKDSSGQIDFGEFIELMFLVGQKYSRNLPLGVNTPINNLPKKCDNKVYVITENYESEKIPQDVVFDEEKNEDPPGSVNHPCQS